MRKAGGSGSEIQEANAAVRAWFCRSLRWLERDVHTVGRQVESHPAEAQNYLAHILSLGFATFSRGELSAGTLTADSPIRLSINWV
jgi:hypothetical protein